MHRLRCRKRKHRQRRRIFRNGFQLVADGQQFVQLARDAVAWTPGRLVRHFVSQLVLRSRNGAAELQVITAMCNGSIRSMETRIN